MSGSGTMMDFNNRMNQLRSEKKSRSAIKLKRGKREILSDYRKTIEKEGLIFKEASEEDLMRIRASVKQQNSLRIKKRFFALVIAIIITFLFCSWLASVFHWEY